MDTLSGNPPTTLDALARAAVRIFRPMVRILLRHNVSYKTCADWLRWCYADVAHAEFTLPGRKQSKSRIAVLTGLTRVDVNQLLATPAPDQVPQQEQYHRAGLVLSGWANDPVFRDGDKPRRILPFESSDTDEPSFSQLVGRHSGGAPARAVLDELERSGAVRVLPDRMIELVRSRYITPGDGTDINYSDVFGLACGELINTIDYNWNPDADDARSDKRLQLVVYNRSIDPTLVEAAREAVESAAREVAERVDELLYHFEQKSRELEPSGPEPIRVGLGLYYFQSENESSLTSKGDVQ